MRSRSPIVIAWTAWPLLLGGLLAWGQRVPTRSDTYIIVAPAQYIILVAAAMVGPPLAFTWLWKRKSRPGANRRTDAAA